MPKTDATPLSFMSLSHVDGQMVTAPDGRRRLSRAVRPHLNVSTPAGRVREVPLSRTNLYRIIEAATAALQALDAAEEARHAQD